MRDTYKVAGLVAALFMVAPSARATDPIPPAEQKQPPRIVASPTTAVVQPTIPVGAPVPLDVGKFVWLDLAGHAGPVTWDDLPKGVVEFYPDPPAGAVVADHYPGIRQGESARAWHKVPNKSSVPCYGVSEGTVKIAAWASVDGRAKKIAELTIQVGPRPPPDVKPDPKPDDPEPPVSANPFGNVAGLHVFISFDRKETEPQKGIIYGGAMRAYLDAKCAVGPDGRTKAYKIWPVETQVGDEFKLWTDAFAKTGGKRRLLIGNGSKGYDGDLPANVDEMLKLLKQYEE